MEFIEYRKNRFEISYRKASLLDRFYAHFPILFIISILVITAIDIALGVKICK